MFITIHNMWSYAMRGLLVREPWYSPECSGNWIPNSSEALTAYTTDRYTPSN
jgi:hypothetical protein